MPVPVASEHIGCGHSKTHNLLTTPPKRLWQNEDTTTKEETMTKSEREKMDKFYRNLPDHTLALIVKGTPKDATEKRIHKIAADEQAKRTQAIMDNIRESGVCPGCAMRDAGPSTHTYDWSCDLGC